MKVFSNIDGGISLHAAGSGASKAAVRKTAKKQRAGANVAPRIEETFKRLSKRGEKALVAFVTAGDPDMKTSEEIVVELARSGADIIELGIPFSDPMADGPTIQASSERAISAGATLKSVLGLVRSVRSRIDAPIVLFGYYNPIFSYGPRRFAREAAKAGADGVLVVDLPPEEAAELAGELKDNGLDHICLLTPTSDSKRMKLVSGSGTGFLYYVSLTGVTGARARLEADPSRNIRRIKRFSRLPVCVGFGISRPEHVSAAARLADGVVVGSAIINVIHRHSGGPKGRMIKSIGRFVRGLKNATKG